MNQEFKKEWLEALRSGEYEQGKYELKTDDNKYCCLGVACDILEKQGVLKSEGSLYFNTHNSDDYNSKELPNIAKFKMEVSDINPSVMCDVDKLPGNLASYYAEASGDYVWTTLAQLNDNGYTFLEIADIIEEQL